MKIRKGDKVEVISGKDRGKRGEVLRVDPARERVYVEGANIVKRHRNPMQNQLAEGQDPAAANSGIMEFEGPIHVSNVMVIDPSTDKPTKVGIKREDGKRVRYSRSSGNVID